MGEQERADLEALIAEPERIEIHGGDRMWRAHLLGAVMATAALSFGPAQAEAPKPAPSFVPGAQATLPGGQETLVAAVMRRAGAQEIATASRSTQVAMYPFRIAPRWPVRSCAARSTTTSARTRACFPR